MIFFRFPAGMWLQLLGMRGIHAGTATTVGVEQRQGQPHLMHLLCHPVRLRSGHVALVQDRHNGEVLLKGEVEVRDGLRLQV